MEPDKNFENEKRPALEPVFASSILCYCKNMASQHDGSHGKITQYTILFQYVYIFISVKKKKEFTPMQLSRWTKKPQWHPLTSCFVFFGKRVQLAFIHRPFFRPYDTCRCKEHWRMNIFPSVFLFEQQLNIGQQTEAKDQPLYHCQWPQCCSLLFGCRRICEENEKIL